MGVSSGVREVRKYTYYRSSLNGLVTRKVSHAIRVGTRLNKVKRTITICKLMLTSDQNYEWEKSLRVSCLCHMDNT